jgi:hypothetical protein
MIFFLAINSTERRSYGGLVVRMDMENEISYPGKRGKVEIARAYGAMSKAEVFEELIWIVCKKRVKLKPAPVGGGHDD